MTNEARVLKDLRLQHGLSMRKAGSLIGRSDSYIAHIETGRMDTPKGEKLERLLNIYGNIKPKSFYERVSGYKKRITPRAELIEIVKRQSEEKVILLLKLAKNVWIRN